MIVKGRMDLLHRHHIIAQCEHMGQLARHRGLAGERMGLLERHMVLAVRRDPQVRHMEQLERQSHGLEHHRGQGLDHASPFVILRR